MSTVRPFKQLVVSCPRAGWVPENIEPEMFPPEVAEYGDAYRYELKVFDTYGRPPSIDELTAEFPNLEWPDAPEDPGHYAELVHQAIEERKIIGWIDKVGPHLDRKEGIDIAAVNALVQEWASSLNGHAPTGRRDPFRSAAELEADESADVQYIAKPFSGHGLLTLVIGKIKEGKTTFVGSLASHVARGLSFLGEPTERMGVVWLSEEPTVALKAGFERCGLLGRTDVHFLTRRDIGAMKWPQVVDLAVNKCEATGSLLVVDTLARLAGLKGKEENDSGAAAAAMEPLRQATFRGIPVIALRHDGKGESELQDAGRGSSAFSGDADIVCRIRKPPVRAGLASTYREIELVGRLDCLEPFLVEWDAERQLYRLHGSTPAHVAEVRQERIEEAIVAALTVEEDALSLSKLSEVTGRNKEALLPALIALVESKTVAETVRKPPKGGKACSVYSLG